MHRVFGSQKKNQQSVARQTGGNSILGAFLSFSLAGNVYAVEVCRIRGLIDHTVVLAPRQKSPACVAGSVSWRGEDILVIDLLTRMGLREYQALEAPFIIVLNIRETGSEVPAGFLADDVLGIFSLRKSQLQQASQDCSGGGADCLLGIAQVFEESIALIDVDKALGEVCRIQR